MGHSGEIPQKQSIADQEKKIQEYEMCQGMSIGLQEQMLQAVDEQNVRALKDNLVSYKKVTPLKMVGIYGFSVSLEYWMWIWCWLS